MYSICPIVCSFESHFHLLCFYSSISVTSVMVWTVSISYNFVFCFFSLYSIYIVLFDTLFLSPLTYNPAAISGWTGFGLSDPILAGIQALQFKTPLPIQGMGLSYDVSYFIQLCVSWAYNSPWSRFLKVLIKPRLLTTKKSLYD